MSFHSPETLQEALALLGAGPRRLLAGGTDLFPGNGAGPGPGDRVDLVDLSRIAGLRGISRDAQGWRLGAMTTWRDLSRARLPARFAGLQQVARSVGSVQIQNTATLAGNICNASPAADGVPALLTLDAQVEIAAPQGPRQLPLDAFITGPRATVLGPDEIVTALHVPHGPGCRGAAFEKLGARRYLVISIAMVAAELARDGDRITQARIAVGACSPVALRLPHLEAALVGLRRAEIAAMAFDRPEFFTGLAPIDDMRATAHYRRQMVPVLCRRAVLAALAGAQNDA